MSIKLYESEVYMSYEIVIEQIKTLPEQFLTSISAFIKFLEAEKVERM